MVANTSTVIAVYSRVAVPVSESFAAKTDDCSKLFAVFARFVGLFVSVGRV